MGKPLAAEKRERIVKLLAQDNPPSHGAIAKKVGCAQSTVSKVAKAEGFDTAARDQSNLARAHEARRAYGAERRAERLVKLADRIDRIIERMAEPHVAFNFGGKDNDYNERTFPEPTTEAIDKYAAAIAKLTRAEMEIVKYDERGDDDGADVDRWLAEITGGG